MKYRKKPVVIEATQWFKVKPISEVIVKEFIVSKGMESSKCGYCKLTMEHHGWIDTLEGGHTVCPGDFIITGVHGEHYPCKPDIFEATYEKVEE